MTNQEAIGIIKTVIAQVEWDYPMDYAVAFDKAVEALEKQEWISVKDRMPEEDVDVLAHNGVAQFIAAYTTNPSKHWYTISGFTICPTHWMSLPEPPKEG